jgi:hypothetical protein
MTHAWRISRRVDGVLQRPAPHFHAFNSLLSIHVLGVSPEGHAVILVKVGTSGFALQCFQGTMVNCWCLPAVGVRVDCRPHQTFIYANGLAHLLRHRWRAAAPRATLHPEKGFLKPQFLHTLMLRANSLCLVHLHLWILPLQTAGAKAMVDAVFSKTTSSSSSLTPAQLEDHLALINEYLVRRAAPDPLPAGSQVQIYDMSGFKLSYAMGGDVMNLFQVRACCWDSARL